MTRDVPRGVLFMGRGPSSRVAYTEIIASLRAIAMHMFWNSNNELVMHGKLLESESSCGSRGIFHHRNINEYMVMVLHTGDKQNLSQGPEKKLRSSPCPSMIEHISFWPEPIYTLDLGR
ncbi:hypothetical protein OPV22_018813 [Ensete ventricosum]|uniref:Uncharacterized protein n=1 Tax=Ensete ventricosum TaxID=4639 RepID=A0AAV8R0C2_ENSVE|nr:hypothetical protein OPV22_018813 [Ensete ventricosum]